MSTATQEVKAQTYFAYGPGPNADKPHEPWALTITIGGERIRTSNNEKINSPFKAIRFSKQGVYHTADPDEIAVLDKHAEKPGSGVTKDHELFLSKTLDSGRLAARLQQQIKGLEEEKNRLRAQLAQDAKGGK